MPNSTTDLFERPVPGYEEVDIPELFLGIKATLDKLLHQAEQVDLSAYDLKFGLQTLDQNIRHLAECVRDFGTLKVLRSTACMAISETGLAYEERMKQGGYDQHLFNQLIHQLSAELLKHVIPVFHSKTPPPGSDYNVYCMSVEQVFRSNQNIKGYRKDEQLQPAPPNQGEKS